MEVISVIIFGIIILIVYLYYGRSSRSSKGNHGDVLRAKNSTIFKMFGGGGKCQASVRGHAIYPESLHIVYLAKGNLVRKKEHPGAITTVLDPGGGFGASALLSGAFLYNTAKHMNVILDKFKTLDEVSDAVRKAGLEACGLIFGIDFTASNIHQGLKTNGGRSLHHLDMRNPNPYQRVISILGETLEPFDDDGFIPAFGFGDISTRDYDVFPFVSQGVCQGFHNVLEVYKEIAQRARLSGPTNFAPLIYRAIDIVKKEKSYHILVIVADGQVTSERATREAIVEASKWPLSIILVGVGDGPWDMMEEFDDSIPQRKFDNFQFVDFHKIMSTTRNPHAAFALTALMEIPDQYKTIRKLGLLNF